MMVCEFFEAILWRTISAGTRSTPRRRNQTGHGRDEKQASR